MTQKTLRCLVFVCVFLVVVATVTPAVAGKKKHPPTKPINLNTATAGELQELPGVGPATAKAILDFRAKSGPFHRVEDLLSVHGLSEKRLDKLRPYVTISPTKHEEQRPPQVKRS